MAKIDETNKIERLRIVEALQDDAYKGIARVDPPVMRKLGLDRGDIISIKGERESYCIVDYGYPADSGENIIRIDGITRKNIKSGIGENVEIKKVNNISEAKKITIAPLQKGIAIKGDIEAIKINLLGKPFNKGDIFVLGNSGNRKDLMGEDFQNFFSDIFNQMGMGMPVGMSQIRFIVVSTNPTQPCIITEDTQISLSNKTIDINDENIPEITYEDIGGLTKEVKQIRETIELPMKHPEIFERLGIRPPKGVLLYGAPGTGKTLLAKAVANESGANFIEFNTAQISSSMLGKTEQNIQNLFDEAKKNAPSIIFIDEIDSIAIKREDRGVNEFLNIPVMELLKQMDGLNNRGDVVVIGATNRIEAIDSALRRPGRFDREIEIGVPEKNGRLQIFKIHTRNMPLSNEIKLDELAEITYGFVGADISALCKEAAICALRRVFPDWNSHDEDVISREKLLQLQIIKGDFSEALKVVRPSAMREVYVEIPDIRWDDIGGIEKSKQELRETIEWSLKYPKSFSRIGIRPPKGVLLYGAPGTGKTLLAKAVAKESGANFISIKGPELQKEGIVGKETERLRRMFEKARQVSPCVVFFDEIDSIAQKRGLGTGVFSESNETILNTLLMEMDGLEITKDVIVIAATNRPDILDPALMRPGRFDRIVYVSIPQENGRLQIFEIHTKDMPLKEKENVIKKLAKKTEGYTGADIENLCREAGMLALRENIDCSEVTEKHFDKAMEKVLPSVSQSDEERYKQIEKKYLRSALSTLDYNNQKSYLA